MKSTLFYLSLLIFMSVNTLRAQNNCCLPSTVSPEITTGVHATTILVNQNTPMAVLNVNASADLPNVEYIITKRNTPAIDQYGMPTSDDVIIGSTLNGVFTPMNVTKHGVTLAAGDTCDLTAIGYDLAIVKNLTDSLLNGASGGQPCCNLFVVLAAALGSPSLASFCTTLNNAGITSGNDVNNISDVLTVFDAMSTTGQTSIPSMLSTLQLINSNGTFISSDCGGAGATNFLPYGIVPTAKYAYAIGTNSTASGHTCCLATTVAPEITTGVHATTIPVNQNTPMAVLNVNASADLPNVEYIITKRNTPAIDQYGMPTSDDVIIGSTLNGVFTPMNVTKHGVTLAAGDTCDLTAIGYDLAIVKNLTDSLLNGATGGQPCCNLFSVLAAALGNPSLASFCTNLNNAGITSGNDVNNISDVLTVFDAISTTGQTSIPSMLSTLQLINSNGAYITTDCGGAGATNFLPYGIVPTAKYAYAIGASSTVSGQNTCCLPTTVAPEVMPGVHSALIPINQNTTAPTLAINASVDLPNVEYLITKRNTPAIDQYGMPTSDDVVLGSDVDGIFMPMNKSRYGISLAVGDTFDLTAIGYDLSVLKTLTDSLLNGYSGNQPCCSFFNLLAAALNEPSIAGFCDSVNNAGIMNAGDVNDMEDVLVIFDALSTTGQISISSLVSTIQLLNSNGTFISSDCGGTGANDFLSYGINPSKRYGYVIDNPLAVQELNNIARFIMYPNPASTYVQMHFTTEEAMDLSVNVYDLLGQQVISKNLGSINGDYMTSLSTANLAKGVYSVELTNGNDRKIYKLTIK